MPEQPAPDRPTDRPESPAPPPTRVPTTDSSYDYIKEAGPQGVTRQGCER